ncbi:MAG: DUF3667 domain-containing protein [Pseudomonadota bacterium]
MGQRKVTICENCRTTLQGDFCHECGQRGVELRRPVIGLVQDILIETLALDGRLLRTTRGMLFNPGKVAKEYVEGQRAKYTPPFRMFLFLSLVCFFAIFTTIQMQTSTQAVGNTTEATVGALTLTGTGADAEERELGNATVNLGFAKLQRIKGEGWTYTGPDWLRSTALSLSENIDLASQDSRLFMAQVRENVPRVLLVMPFFYVLLLYLFYFYKDLYLYDLLVISLYMHSALYLYLLVAIVFETPPIPRWGGDIVASIIQLWGIVQSYRVLRTNFGSGWIMTITKGLLINGAFWIMAGIMMLIGLAVSLL